jgi:hypothetical protein
MTDSTCWELPPTNWLAWRLDRKNRSEPVICPTVLAPEPLPEPKSKPKPLLPLAPSPCPIVRLPNIP